VDRKSSVHTIDTGSGQVQSRSSKIFFQRIAWARAKRDRTEAWVLPVVWIYFINN